MLRVDDVIKDRLSWYQVLGCREAGFMVVVELGHIKLPIITLQNSM